MKKIFSAFVLIALVFSLTSCDISFITQFLGEDKDSGGIVPGPSDENEEKEDPDDSQEPAEPACDHNYVEIDRTEAKPLSDGVIIYECSRCKGKTTEVHTPMTRSLKILAIGNSHSENAVAYLWDICNAAGISELVIGNAVVGGTGLDDHGSYMLYGNPIYSYTKYEDGKSVSRDGLKITEALQDEEWDYITIQQRSQYVNDSRFTLLGKIIEFLNAKCPDAEIYWHMTWAYETNPNMGQSIKNEFSSAFGEDTSVMYEAIIDSVEKHILNNEDISGILPAGTAIQNLRSSYIGNDITTDGVHVKGGIGKYTVALIWYSVFTGGSLDAVEWLPQLSSMKDSITDNYEIIIEAVTNALNKPMEVTASQYTEAPAN